MVKHCGSSYNLGPFERQPEIKISRSALWHQDSNEALELALCGNCTTQTANNKFGQPRTLEHFLSYWWHILPFLLVLDLRL